MKKIFINILLFAILLFCSGSALAVQIINPLSSANFCQLATKISTEIAGLVGALSVIMIIIAGIMYLVSAGDPQKTNAAKSALKYAIMGIVIALIAGAIVATIQTILGAANINVCQP